MRQALQILFALWLLFPCVSRPEPAAAGVAVPTREILFLGSYHKGEPWTDSIIEAFDQRLSTYGLDYEIHYEFMDKRRIIGPEHDRYFLQLIQHKYEAATIDLIVCSGDEALDFMLSNRKKFLPAVPVVFCGITDLFRASNGMGAAVTGVAEGIDIRGTVEAALGLFPQAQTIAFISDSGNDGTTVNRFRAIKDHFPEVTFVFLENLALTETLAELHRLPADTIIIQGAYDTRKDPTMPFARYLQLLTKSVSLPVFSLWDHAVGAGVVGGKVVTAYAQGNEAGKIAVRILNGEKPEKTPIVLQEADRYMFDERQLVRFNLRESDLPDNSTVLPLRGRVAKRDVPWGVALPGAAAGLIFMSLRRYRGWRKKKSA